MGTVHAAGVNMSSTCGEFASMRRALKPLKKWLQGQGGYIHPAIGLSSSTTSGGRLGTRLHYIAQYKLQDQTAISFDSWDMQHLQHNLVTRVLIVTKDIDEERIMRGPLIKLSDAIRITTELAKQKLAPILQAAGLPDVQDTKNSAIMAGTVSCQVC